jgi:hypothetical protein
MLLWHSESDGLGDLRTDKIEGLYRVGATNDPATSQERCENVILVTDSYELTGSRCTGILFLGPDSEKIAKAWVAYAENLRNEENDHLHLNTETDKAIKEFLAKPIIGF